MSDIKKAERSAQWASLEWPMGQVNFEAAQQFWKRSESFAKALSDWNAEITHFASQRVNRSSEAVSRVTQCRSLPEVFEVEAQWLRGAYDDYFAEARRLMEVNSRIVSSLVEATVEAPTIAAGIAKRERADAAD
jgi:hypothetical protein